MLHAAAGLGVNFFDTAEGYGSFENERLLGEAFKGSRSDVVIATKFGFDLDPETGDGRGAPTVALTTYAPQPTRCSSG